MPIDSRTIALFKETRTKLKALFRTNLAGAQTDGHYSNPLKVDAIKGVMIKNKHGETIFVPEDQYNRFFEKIIPKNDCLETFDANEFKKFTPENQFWLGDIAYVLRDYKPQTDQ